MADGQADVVRAFLLQPDMSGVVVGQLDDQEALVFRKRGRNLLDELLLPLNVHRREELVLVNGLEQRFVFVLALLFGVGERRHVPQLAVELELRGALIGEFEKFFRGGHAVILPRVRYANVTRTIVSA